MTTKKTHKHLVKHPKHVQHKPTRKPTHRKLVAKPKSTEAERPVPHDVFDLSDAELNTLEREDQALRRADVEKTVELEIDHGVHHAPFNFSECPTGHHPASSSSSAGV